MTGRSKTETVAHYAALAREVEPLKRHLPPTLEQVEEAFTAETRGDGAKLFDEDRGCMVFDTVQGVEVEVYVDTWSYYGPIWNARLVLPAQDFTVPLLEGPHIDEHQPTAEAIADVVAWLRKITDAEADQYDPEEEL